jgi:hypothetical protein
MATTYWVALFGLGAFHGLNPGMGWLFAVALGLQEGERRAVWRAMLPLGLGHALAVAAAVVAAIVAGQALPLPALQLMVGVLLLALGVYRLARHRHPRYGGMRVGMTGLTVWSFLMASAHGAGVMVLPAVLGGVAGAHPAHAGHAVDPGSAVPTLALATLLHGAGYLLATAAAAWIVFEKLGVLVLRRAWWNVDRIWAFALIGTGVACVLLARAG